MEHITKKHQGLPNLPGPAQKCDASPPLVLRVPHLGGQKIPGQTVAMGPPVIQQHLLSLFERLEKVRREEREVAGLKDDLNSPHFLAESQV